MKDKEKIEEMAKEIEKAKQHIWASVRTQAEDEDYLWHSRAIAEHLILQGYRKLPKDSVVLSKEELNTIQANFFVSGIKGGSKETAEKFMVLRGYITKQFHKYHEARDKAESEYKKCKEEMGKAVLNNDWHRCDAIMFILEDIATEFDKLAKQFGVEIKE